MSRDTNMPLKPDPRSRERAMEIARAAGELGATRLPDEALALTESDDSDTAMFALLTALDAGQLVRREE